MASIEQDDLFNVGDDEDMEDEELDVPQQEDYPMEIEEEEEEQPKEDVEMNEGEYDEDQDQDDDDDEGEGEDEDEEEDDEDDENGGEEQEEEEEEDEDEEDEEEEDEEEEEEEEEREQSTGNVSTAITSPRSKDQDDSKLIVSEEQDQLPSTLIEENKDEDGDILLGQEASETTEKPQSQSQPSSDESKSTKEHTEAEEKKDNKEKPSQLPQPEQKEQKTLPKEDDNTTAPEIIPAKEPEQPSTITLDKQEGSDQQEESNNTTEQAKDKEQLIDDMKESQENLTFRERIIAKARKATEFDIIPQVAIPYTSQCHSLAFTEGPKWILTGGEDGFIRKYDFIASIQGKSPLTMAQKHNLLSDSLTNAGVICSYWENEQPLTRKQLMKQNPKLKDSDFSTGSVSYEPKVNPVYALDAERNGYWCLSGLLSGGISLYTMRYNEGTIHHYFHHGSRENPKRGHNDAVSVLKLNQEQDKFLSGSWDKTIRQWDLNTGKTIIEYAGSSGQISNIQFRPDGLGDIVFTCENQSSPSPPPPPQKEETNSINKENDNDNDDIDSLFGGDDDDDDEDIDMDKSENKPLEESLRKAEESIDTPHNNNPGSSSTTHLNSNIFMSSSIDGTINIWDIRTANPVIRIGVSEGTPPWCMSLSWSNNGDFIYAGRRNSTIEEISIKMPHKKSNSGHHKDTMIPNISKLLQFPKISGPVSALSTMPNDDFLLCGSNDNIRLYNLKLYDDLNNEKFNLKKQATPFLIIPGHHGGMLSLLYVDETGRFMVSSSGYRGWGHGAFTDSVLVYEIDFQ